MENERVTVELPDGAQHLLWMIQQAPDWVSRKELARQYGNERLTSTQQAYLDILVRSGLIEGEQRKISSPIGYQWLYRAATPAAKSAS